MNILLKKLGKKVGASPGDVSYVGEKEPEKTLIKLIQYDKESFSNIEITSLDDLKKNISETKVNWINITGLSDVEIIKSIGIEFGIHNLSLEDAMNTGHMPKYEEIEKYLMFISKGYIETNDNKAVSNHLCMFLSGNVLITIQDSNLDLITTKTERIEHGKGKARSKETDYLFYLLLDAYVDTYYTVFDILREKIVNLEEKLLSERSKNFLNDILALNQELSNLRKIVFPQKKAVTELVDSDTDLINNTTQKYLVDLQDHVNDLSEHYQSFMEQTKNLIVLNDNNLNADTNRVMKTLTIIATIFIPLTFIAGLYGMNFKYMPELEYQYGYPIALASMFIVGIGLLLLMKWKKWF